MKIKVFLFSFFLFINFGFKAQNYVTIPDANFVTWLQTNYPNCMNGNQMDTTCTDLNENIIEVNLDNMGLTDLTGVKHLNINILYCINNNLTFIPELPPNLFSLYIIGNQISEISNLNPALRYLNCSANQISEISNLNLALEYLYCSNNQISEISNINQALKYFDCSNNQINQISNLNSILESLDCSNNQISSLSNLPSSLLSLYCSQNNLTNLPTLPIDLKYFDCSYNNLIYLSNLPENLLTLKFSNNQIYCVPVLPNSIYDSFNLDISNNPFTCLPNYIDAMNDSLLNLPLCIENDFVNNPNGCNPAIGITGRVFSDINSNCSYENVENPYSNLALKLYNSSDSLLRITYSLANGIYQFPQETGTYKVKIDTLNVPFSVQCQSADTTITLDSQNPLVDSVNFVLTCKPGFDVGVQSVTTNGWIFPGQNHKLKILAGDLSQWYNMSCASGISGEIQITTYGPISYQNPSIGSLIPTVSGNTFTYTISDFGNADIETAFGLIFKTDTTAQVGDEICVLVNVTPTNGDNNMSNNIFDYCYHVINSYDPNMKEVYPVNVPPGYDDYFTYTIHFQNTGSAPAFNIRLLDTLDVNLDLETFQVTNYSHYNSTMLKSNILTFHFPNIMLQDSTTDFEGSKGFVQYRIKPKVNLALGTQIKNTANIYFDFNAPIVTNTTVNEYVQTNSIAENESKLMNIFPNPFSSSTTVIFKNSLKNADLTLYNVYGQKVRTISDFSGDKLKLNRENLSSGVYYLSLESEDNQVETVKLVVGE